MTNKTKTFKTIFSITLVSMILFLACDERTPVSSPPPVLSYQLEFFVDKFYMSTKSISMICPGYCTMSYDVCIFSAGVHVKNE